MTESAFASNPIERRTTPAGSLRVVVRSAMFLLCLAAGCGGMEFRSHWKTHEVTIDGNNSDWQDSLTYLLEDKQTSVGFQNDGHDLYVCLISANRDLQRQAFRPGLTFWFDREGGEGRSFGVHYPAGPERPRGGERNDEDRPPDIQNEGGPNGANELEIIGPGENDRRRMTMAEAGGIEARFHSANGLLVYELKVPLSGNGAHPFAVGATPGATIGVGVEAVRIQERERPPDATGGGDEGRGGGYGGRGGGRGGRGGRGGGGGRSGPGGQGELFSLWAKVQLAAGETGTH